MHYRISPLVTPVVLAAVGLMLTATGAQAATASADASAAVVPAIAISKTQDLNFGHFVPGTSSGTVTVTPAGTRTASSGLTLTSAVTATQASFTVTGDAGATYAVTLPSSISITHTNGINGMTVNTFTSNPSGSGTLTGGTSTLNVGATLQVGANQLAGNYSGSFDVTVEYN